MAQNKKQNRGPQNTPMGHVGGSEKQQSSMRKLVISPARIPEITKSSRAGMTLHSGTLKQTPNAGATKVVRNEKTGDLR